jgi:hypothetical protein
MISNEMERWLRDVKNRASAFLDQLKGENGFFRYSAKGDLYDQTRNWGLANTVFAVKIYAVLNLIDGLPKMHKEEMQEFIHRFTLPTGEFHDQILNRNKSLIKSIIRPIKLQKRFQDIKRAETRQAVSALKLLGEYTMTYRDFPLRKDDVLVYCKKLDWNKPWDAASHVSHLLFFLHHSTLSNKQELTDTVFTFLRNVENEKTGSWHTDDVLEDQAINSAMKILTGMNVTSRIECSHPKKLIDTCLKATQNNQACDNFNIVYCLKYADQCTSSKYRHEEIAYFCKNRLSIYQKYYHQDHGGFSFYIGQANTTIYDAKITKGFNEPDIHGTVMFLWGIAVIGDILDYNKHLGFHVFTP